MDTLPVALTAPCLSVEHVTVTRMMNSARRRLPFQRKVGTGLSPTEFSKKIASGEITGHVGLVESMQMIAAGLGWELTEYAEEPPKPVMAEGEVETGLGTFGAGTVVGLSSVAHARDGSRERIRLAFHAYAGVAEEYDEIIIDGNPPLHQRIHGGVHGDVGTVAVTVNTAVRAAAAPPGLLTMIELPPVAVVN
jgi:4-hydroxy-tetrahydrodipicolinate reductase